MTDNTLRRSMTDNIIAGVCSGLSDYLEVDATAIRLAFILLSFLFGLGILTYLLCWWLIPEAEESVGRPSLSPYRATDDRAPSHKVAQRQEDTFDNF